MELHATHPATCENGAGLCTTLSFNGGFTSQMFIVVWQESLTVFFSRWWLYSGPLWRSVTIICNAFSALSFTHDCCVNTPFGEISLSTLPSFLSHTSAVFGAPAPLVFHMHALSAKSFIKCSGCYDNYECGARCYIRIWSSSCTAAHLQSFNAMVIMQAILGKQLKQRSVLKDQ